MQQDTTGEQVSYASVGWRVAAVLVDTAVLFAILMLVIVVWVLVLVSQGKVDPNDPAAAQALAQDIGAGSDLVANVVLFGALFIYYALLEGIFGASIGKLVFRMHVVMIDGSRPTGGAIVVRNLIRIPEAALLYIPSGASCLASSRRQRLGDHAARTVVVRRAAGAMPFRPMQAPPYGQGPQSPANTPQTGVPPAPPAYGPPAQDTTPDHAGSVWTGDPAPQVPPATPAGAWPAAPATTAAAAPAPSLSDALASLKTAALAARGAHLTYLHFSERELAAGMSDHAEGYSNAYVSAWFTLADAVASFRAAHAAASAAAAAAGRTPDEAYGPHPDLAHLLQALAPYLAAESDDQVHEAFLVVARAEAQAP